MLCGFVMVAIAGFVLTAIHRTGMGSVDHRGRGRAKSHFDFLVGAFTWNAALRNRWFADSLLEGGGFELPVRGHR